MTPLAQLLWALQDLGHLSGYLCTISRTLTTKSVFHVEERARDRSMRSGKEDFGITGVVLSFCLPFSIHAHFNSLSTGPFPQGQDGLQVLHSKRGLSVLLCEEYTRFYIAAHKAFMYLFKIKL